MLPFLKALRLSLLFTILGSATAVADEKMRRDMLARDHDKCLIGCLANNDGAVCEMLCGCTLDAFGDLAFEDYVRLNIELNSGRVSEANKSMLTEVALTCAAEVDQAYPELAPEQELPASDEEGE